jgi:hypothetical protein
MPQYRKRSVRCASGRIGDFGRGRTSGELPFAEASASSLTLGSQALRLYAHIHAASRLSHLCNDAFVQTVDGHPHLLRDGDEYRWERDSWEPLFSCVTYKGVKTRIKMVDYEQWDCGRCQDAFESATEELLDGLDDLTESEDNW